MINSYIKWFSDLDIYRQYIQLWPSPLNNPAFISFLFLLAVFFVSLAVIDSIKSAIFRNRLHARQRQAAMEKYDSTEQNSSTDALMQQYMRFLMLAQMNNAASNMQNMTFEQFKEKIAETEETPPLPEETADVPSNDTQESEEKVQEVDIEALLPEAIMSEEPEEIEEKTLTVIPEQSIDIFEPVSEDSGNLDAVIIGLKLTEENKKKAENYEEAKDSIIRQNKAVLDEKLRNAVSEDKTPGDSVDDSVDEDLERAKAAARKERQAEENRKGKHRFFKR